MERFCHPIPKCQVYSVWAKIWNTYGDPLHFKVNHLHTDHLGGVGVEVGVTSKMNTTAVRSLLSQHEQATRCIFKTLYCIIAK